jgi:hypothetical protein
MPTHKSEDYKLSAVEYYSTADKHTISIQNILEYLIFLPKEF